MFRDVKIEGSTVLDEQAIRDIVSPYLGKPVNTEDLEEIRRRFTLLCVDRGFINSGAIIPDQNVENGVVTFRFVEGRVTDIEVSGTDHFDPEYFRSRLERVIKPPFKVENLGNGQQILLQSPRVRRLNLELLPGLEPGVFPLQVVEAKAGHFDLPDRTLDAAQMARVELNRVSDGVLKSATFQGAGVIDRRPVQR